MMNSGRRLRFAPSPTGYLHLGGLRTALYNFVFARQDKGKVFLRIEDTDQSRIVPGAVEGLRSILGWCGIQFDAFDGDHSADIVVQSQRLNLYKKYSDILLERGAAYRCFCSKRRLNILKKSQLALKEFPRYDNRCRNLREEEIHENLKQNIPHVVRLKLPQQNIAFDDLLFGNISIDYRQTSESDPVLLKSEGYPTYHLANVVDDHYMNITHVLRGAEWLQTTCKHKVMYDALEWQLPLFAHLPLLINKDGSKLSKRQGDVFVEEYKSKGYSPSSMLNFVSSGSGFQSAQLPLLGDEASSVESVLEELTQTFSLQDILSSPSVLEFPLLNVYNNQILSHIASSEKGLDQLTQNLWSAVSQKFGRSTFLSKVNEAERNEYIRQVCKHRTHHLTVMKELVADSYDYLWTRPDADSIDVTADDVLLVTINILKSSDNNVTAKNIGNQLRENIKTINIKYSQAMKSLRQCLIGREVGPSFAELLEILGREECILRLNSALHKISD